MTAYYKVRNDASVSSLSRICMRIHELIDAPVLVDIVIEDVKDVRIYLMPPRSAAALMELRKMEEHSRMVERDRELNRQHNNKPKVIQ